MARSHQLPECRQQFAKATAFVLVTVTAAITSFAGTRLTAQEPDRPAEETSPPASGVVRPAAPTAEQISVWIDALKNDSYAVRQESARQLLAAGVAARERLTEAASGPDPESRAAARRLLTLIDKAELDRRLNAFAADTDGREGLTLPGWQQYQKLVGGDAAARALFVEMQRQEASLLASVFEKERGAQGQPGTRHVSWEERLMRLLRSPANPVNGPAGPPLGTCATMIFLGTVADAGVSDQAASYLPSLVQRPPIQQAMQGKLRQDAVRRLVVAWVVECPNRGANVIQQRLGLAILYELSEAVPLAISVARNDPAFLTALPAVRVSALVLVARLGGRGDADKLEPLLDDATVVQPIAAPPAAGGAPVVREIQIRDVALVTMLQLTDQDPADYGYRHARRQSQRLLDPGSLFVDSDSERTAAIAKWREWKVQQGRAATEKQVN